MYGYAEAKVEAAILKKAIADKNLSRQGLLNAKLNLGTVDEGGLIPPVTYTPALGPASRTSEIAAVSTSAPGFLKIVRPFFEGAAAKAMAFK
jgi:hypothetical protein